MTFYVKKNLVVFDLYICYILVFVIVKHNGKKHLKIMCERRFGVTCCLHRHSPTYFPMYFV